MNFQDTALSEHEQIGLSRCIGSATISQRDGRRTRVILLGARGCSHNENVRLTGLFVVSFTRWYKRSQELRLQDLVGLPGRDCKPSLPTDPLNNSLGRVSANPAGSVEAWLKSTVFHRPASSGYGPPMK